jgi:riboflavin biosynthesis pyrimidine reductase
VESSEGGGLAETLKEAGVRVTAASMMPDGLLDVGGALRRLSAEEDVCRVMVEGGAGLLSSLLGQGLVNECRVFIGPLAMGDERAMSAIVGRDAPRLMDGIPLKLWGCHRRGPDVLLRYGAASASGT